MSLCKQLTLNDILNESYFTGVLCDEALGAANGGTLGNSNFEASSSFSSALVPSQGRLNGFLGWCASLTDSNKYLQVDVGETRLVCAVVTQGYSLGPNFVTRYKIKYSEDGTEWQTVKEDGADKVCSAF